jgi:UDP-3-O-[3-hydroxymyristoyl] N-acetylglucosamine deacetylase/3-hydroxyacyl-[acyl-carrier-protein] dehydratase
MQKTIKSEVRYEGIGLHTGERMTLYFKPAPPNTGVVFVRDGVSLPASVKYVVNCNREISLGKDGVEVHTVEHVLAALAGLGIDNVIVEMTGIEPPVGDGSSLPFANLLLEAGLLNQDEPKRLFRVRTPIWVEDGDSFLVVLPSDVLRITFTISFPHQAIKTQSISFIITPDTFLKHLAPARTFGFLAEVETLRSRGLIKGGTLENAVVVGEDGILNEALRFENELVRHKILDLLGDLFLLGVGISGHVVAFKSGHALNVKLLKKMEALISSSNTKFLDINEIKRILPHRYPFLLVDKVLELEPGKRIKALKNVSFNEQFFQGHFPKHPIMPGVLIVEAMAQAGGILLLSEEENAGKLVYFTGIDKVKFRKPVFPGDQLILEVTPIRIKKKSGKMQGRSFVEGKLVAEGELMFTILDEILRGGEI